MQVLTETLKTMLNALAFADAGEYLTRRQKAAVLQGTPAVAAAAAAAAAAEPVARRPHVALYMGSELPPEVMHYVVQTCAQLGHDLTVLSFQPKVRAEEQLQPYAAALAGAGIDRQLAVLGGDPVPALGRYLRRHQDVAFLVCNESGYLGRGLLNGSVRQDSLSVPVVMVTPNMAQESAAMQPAEPVRVAHAA